MELEFGGEVWFWKGPAPWYFVAVPEAPARELEAAAGAVSYGWGMVPVTARKTSLWPKDGSFLVPLKRAAREAAGIGEGDTVTVRLRVDM